MQEGFTIDKSKFLPAGYKVYGKRIKLQGSSSWRRIVAAEENTTAGALGDANFNVDKVLAGEPIQVFTYRCTQCGYLEAYAPLI
jgi:hypothetical protein